MGSRPVVLGRGCGCGEVSRTAARSSPSALEARDAAELGRKRDGEGDRDGDLSTLNGSVILRILLSSTVLNQLMSS